MNAGENQCVRYGNCGFTPGGDGDSRSAGTGDVILAMQQVQNSARWQPRVNTNQTIGTLIRLLADPSWVEKWKSIPQTLPVASTVPAA
ncbi:MAG: hypothetical protein G01um1014106_315 [Parcubacteria group bacterium Gr01-1014_106]|nr:MAG: hypothetical protein G01um1014106_315 [Parcubacteria group bacterium Gr01-1014_106]